MERRDFLRIAGFWSLGFLSGCAPKRVAETPTNAVWSPGELRATGTISILSEEGQLEHTVHVLYYTREEVIINTVPLRRVVSFISQNGRLPRVATLILTDNSLPPPAPPDAAAMTEASTNLIIMNLRGILNSETAPGYTPYAMANGALVAEFCNLMISESLSSTERPVNIEKECDSLGVMAAAVLSGKSYWQYEEDARTQFYYLGKINNLNIFNEDAFDGLRNSLPQPILEFR